LIALLIGWESFLRLANPVPISFEQAIAVAVVGLIVNVICAWLLRDDHAHHHHGHDHHHQEHGDARGGHARNNNLRAAYRSAAWRISEAQGPRLWRYSTSYRPFDLMG
jgi:Co/Zn/Cd efflux system component